jgi:hypothetical protein
VPSARGVVGSYGLEDVFGLVLELVEVSMVWQWR